MIEISFLQVVPPELWGLHYLEMEETRGLDHLRDYAVFW